MKEDYYLLADSEIPTCSLIMIRNFLKKNENKNYRGSFE